MKNMLTFINTRWMNCNHSQRWIESLIGERPTNSKNEFPLPEGEGQGEGEERTVTKLRIGFSHGSTASFRFDRPNSAQRRRSDQI